MTTISDDGPAPDEATAEPPAAAAPPEPPPGKTPLPAPPPPSEAPAKPEEDEAHEAGATEEEGQEAPAKEKLDRRALAGKAFGWLLALLSWVGPTVVAGFVVGYQAVKPQLWRDEFASWSVATRTLPEIFELGKHIDGVTVPYYLFLHYWIGWFGDSALAMRTPSIIAMTVTAGLVALIAQRLWGNLAGFWAGLLISAAPVSSRFGQEIRGYALAAMFVALATYLLVVGLQKTRWWWVWPLYAIAVALIGLAHQVAVLALAGHLIAVLASTVRRGERHRLWLLLWWSLATAAGLAVVVPIAVNGLSQHGSQLSWLAPSTLTELANQLGSIFSSAVVAGAIAAIAVFALPRRGEQTLNAGWVRVFWLSALIPFGVLYAVDQLVAPIFLSRYLIFIVPMLCIPAGLALSRLRFHTALVAGLVVAAVGLPAQVDARTTHSVTDYRSIAQLFQNWSRPGDGVMYAPAGGWQFTGEAMRFYLGDAAPRDFMSVLTPVQNASLWGTECRYAPDCGLPPPRIWTVIAKDSHDPSLPTVLQLSETDKDILADYRRSGRWDVPGFIINLYLPKPVKTN